MTQWVIIHSYLPWHNGNDSLWPGPQGIFLANLHGCCAQSHSWSTLQIRKDPGMDVQVLASTMWKSHHMIAWKSELICKLICQSHLFESYLFLSGKRPNATGINWFSLNSALRMKVWYHKWGVMRKVPSARIVCVRAKTLQLSSEANSKTLNPSLWMMSPLRTDSWEAESKRNQLDLQLSSACVDGVAGT